MPTKLCLCLRLCLSLSSTQPEGVSGCLPPARFHTLGNHVQTVSSGLSNTLLLTKSLQAVPGTQLETLQHSHNVHTATTCSRLGLLAPILHTEWHASETAPLTLHVRAVKTRKDSAA